MFLPKFRHLRPQSIDEAVQLLTECGPEGRPFAGGTELLPRMKYGLIRPEAVISLRGIPVRAPRLTPEGDLSLDTLTPLADLARSPLVTERTPLLTEAALQVGSNQIRQMGTLGGNLCLDTRCSYYNQSHTFQFVDPCFKRGGDRCYLLPKGKKCCAVFCGDTAPALISLGAFVTIIGPEGDRQLPVENLYTGDPLKPIAISETELLTEVLVPGHSASRRSGFGRFSLRGGVEFAGLNVAVVLEMEEDKNLCLGVRLTVGAISAAPTRMTGAEEAMRGKRLSKELIKEAAHLTAAEAHPFPHHGYTAAYLRECLKVQTRRTLESALSM
ncbi:MAG: FAD binding domain-containing protein [Desulfobacteraceae bacterium]|nr:FAD binding domain-containing protein [Desulfobacteraceae bacterium]